MRWYVKSNSEVEKFSKNIDKLKIQCKICGRKVPFIINDERKLCDHCGHYIYRNDKLEFKYKMKGAIRNENKRLQEIAKRETTE